MGRFEANFLPGGRQVAFGGAEKESGRRIYVQDIETGAVRPISPPGVLTDALTTSDGRYVVGRSAGKHSLYPTDGGDPARCRPVAHRLRCSGVSTDAPLLRRGESGRRQSIAWT